MPEEVKLSRSCGLSLIQLFFNHYFICGTFLKNDMKGIKTCWIHAEDLTLAGMFDILDKEPRLLTKAVVFFTVFILTIYR